jgi:hypothetical protein
MVGTWKKKYNARIQRPDFSVLVSGLDHLISVFKVLSVFSQLQPDVYEIGCENHSFN